MKPKYCLPIIKTTQKAVSEMITDNQEYDYYEIWLDYINDLEEEFIKELTNQYGKKLIFLFRRQNLETARMDWDKRTGIISSLNNGNSYLDADIFNQKDELKFIQDKQLTVPLIVSYHNYHGTPPDQKIQSIIQSMSEYKPAIVKIATQCNNNTDALRLMHILQQLKQKKLRFIVLGMGEYGKITRIYGLLQGNEFHFAPLANHEQSAQGQLTRKQLEEILSILSLRNEK